MHFAKIQTGNVSSWSSNFIVKVSEEDKQEVTASLAAAAAAERISIDACRNGCSSRQFLSELSVVEKYFELKKKKKKKQVKQTTSSKPQSSENVVRHKSESQDKRLAAPPEIENASRKIGLKLRRVAQSASSTSGVTSRLEKQKEGQVTCGLQPHLAGRRAPDYKKQTTDITNVIMQNCINTNLDIKDFSTIIHFL